MTKLKMYKLAHKAQHSRNIHDDDTARHIVQDYIANTTENTLIVLHGTYANGSWNTTQHVMNYFSSKQFTKDYKTIYSHGALDIHKITNTHHNKKIIITVPETTNLQDVDTHFHTLDNIIRHKPVIMLINLFMK